MAWQHSFFHCVLCGKSWGDFRWLCFRCENEVFKKATLPKRWITKTIFQQSIWGWGDDQQLKTLVHSLKGGGRPREIQKLVDLFAPSYQVSTIFYPDRGRNDHAREIAQAMSAKLRVPVEGLRLVDSSKQSLRNRIKRRERRFFPSLKPVKKALFVDDVVTTGSTAIAAYEALNQPPKMTVWSLFYRKPL